MTNNANAEVIFELTGANADGEECDDGDVFADLVNTHVQRHCHHSTNEQDERDGRERLSCDVG